ncbi:hypothetical protein Tco_0491221 [Tanacetum coccineum]
MEERKKKNRKLLDSNGLDMSKAYMLDTQQMVEERTKCWKRILLQAVGMIRETASFLLQSRSYAIFTVSMVQKWIAGATCGGGATEDQTSAMQKEGANTAEKLLLSYYDNNLYS